MSKQASFPQCPTLEKEYLWLYLLALGLDPGGAATAWETPLHLRLGPNMFDNPNRDAFHIVLFFMFSKLDQFYCNEVFRFCFPPTDKKTDAEFRKQCCDWLRKISDEYGNSFPPIPASLFLSPGGPKFIHVMFHLARCVLLHHIKTDSAGARTYFLDSFNLTPPDFSLGAAKYYVQYHRFLRNLQREDVIIQEHQKKAMVSSKQIRDLRYEKAELDKQPPKLVDRKGKNTNQSQNHIAETVKEVRNIWAFVIETLKHLQKEREVVDSVVKGHSGQYILDGTGTAVTVPRLLLEKVEKEIHTLRVGNIYEAGRLNILTVIQLLNKALEILVFERQHIDKNSLKLNSHYFEEKTKFQNETLLGLKSLRHKLKHQEHVSINQSIAEKEREWDLKWENCLGESPFRFVKEPNPVLDLLPAMPPLSFSPATEEVYKSSVFCQYPASIPDLTKKQFQTNEFKKGSEPLKSEVCATLLNTNRNITSPYCATEPEDGTQIPSEKGSTIETPKIIDPQISKYKRRNKPVEAFKKKYTGVLKKSPLVKNEDPLQKTQEQLAEIVADVVASDLPQNTAGEKELNDLIGTLAFNPFLTRKQIPRTPENLITEIRSSWKKAIEAEESCSKELHHTESPKRTPQNVFPVFRNRMDSSMTCFRSLCVSDAAESPFQELQLPFKLQETSTSPDELQSQQAAIASLDDPVYCKQGSMCTVSKCETENPESVLKNINDRDCALGDDFANMIQPTYPCRDSSVCTVPSWHASQICGFNLDSHEVIHLGILHEALPEDGEGSISLNSSNGLEAGELSEENIGDDHSFADNSMENKQSLDFSSIQSRYSALKKTFHENQDSPRKQIPRTRSEFSLIETSSKTNDFFSPLGKPYSLDAELVKKPLHVTLLQRRVSLPPLFASPPVQPRDRSGRQDQGDLLHGLKEKQ